MKRKLITLFGMFIALSTMASGQFEKAMGQNIPAVFTSKTPEELQGVINKLTRIGAAENDRWEPYYYTAFGYLKMSDMYSEAEDKDKYLDLAMGEVKKGQEIAPENSELEAMRGYVIMMQLVVDPGTRGMTHSGAAMDAFYKAVQLDRSNPRAYYLLGRMQYGTAQFMGGGNGEACANFDKALALFEAGSAEDNPVTPTWGLGSTKGAIQQICGSEE